MNSFEGDKSYFFPISDYPITSNDTYQLPPHDSSSTLSHPVVESDLESFIGDNITLKNSTAKFGGSLEEVGNLNGSFLKELSSSDPHLFTLVSAPLYQHETPYTTTTLPLRDRSISDPCLGITNCVPIDTEVLSLPDLSQTENPHQNRIFLTGKLLGHEDSKSDSDILNPDILRVQELEFDSCEELDNIQQDNFPVVNSDKNLSVQQTLKCEIQSEHIEDIPNINDSINNMGNQITTSLISKPDLTPRSEEQDRSTIEPPIPTDHEPQTSKAFISQGSDIVDNMWDEFSFTKYIIHTPKARKSLRTTIPHPFSVYYKSLKPKKKTQAQIQGEMKRRLEKESEERECSRKFVSRPVPKSTYEPRYQEILAKEENRRQQTRTISKDTLQAIVKPFKFDKRESEKYLIQDSYSTKSSVTQNQLMFKAKPVPKHLFQTRYEDEVAEQDLYREIRKVMRTNQLLSTSRLPASMSASEKTLSYTDGHKRRVREERNSKQAFITAEHKFKPTVNKRMPDFKRQQELFEQKMLERRQEQRLSRLEFSEQDLMISDLDIGGRKNFEITIPNVCDVLMKACPVKKRQVRRVDEVYGHSPTKSTQLRQALVQQRISVQASKERDERDRASEQMERVRRMKRRVVERVKKFDNRGEIQRRAIEKKRDFKEMEESRQSDYTEHLRMIKEKLEERPLVFERVALQSANDGISLDELNNTYTI
ncbi:hypothetical protein LOD99_5575 [Oopsacas minuta]|uniref:Uncharacterized protein n=1 Tax=Oopsacas minuta TaxID=111878 RepID=A0AAV7JPT5_9METZ|nr:hypothetical protein LOD99_5575 [Oopsacas minuta]